MAPMPPTLGAPRPSRGAPRYSDRLLARIFMSSHTVVEGDTAGGGRTASGTHSRLARRRHRRDEWEWLTGDRSEGGCGQRTPSARLPPCHRSARASLVHESSELILRGRREEILAVTPGDFLGDLGWELGEPRHHQDFHASILANWRRTPQDDQNGPDARRPRCEVSAGRQREPSGEMIEKEYRLRRTRDRTIFEPLKRRLRRRTTSPPTATQMGRFHRPGWQT